MRPSPARCMGGSALISRALLLGIVWLIVVQNACGAEPQGVVSTSLCGDAYVMAIEPEANIAALSWQAGGPLSTAPAQLAALGTARADGEILVHFAGRPLVLGPGDSARAEDWAKKAGSPFYRLNWANDFVAIETNLRQLGQFLHQPERANSAIANMQERLAALPKPKGPQPRILYLTPTLGTAGKGTWVDAAIRAAGGHNMATDLGIAGWGRVRLEQLVGRKPDLIVLSYFGDGPPSVFNFRSHHPYLQQVLQSTPTVTVPGKDWVCGGPNLIDASEIMSAAIARLPEPRS